MAGSISQCCGDKMAGSINRNPISAGAGKKTMKKSLMMLGVTTMASNADRRSPVNLVQE